MIEWSKLIQQVVGHLVIYGFAIWNLILGVWLIVRWANNNWKRTKQQAPQILQQSTPQNINPVINVDSAQIGKEMLKRQQDMGPVEVDVKKNIIVGKAEVSDLSKSSDVKRGKVKTQKEKLRKLRGK
jgi:hypothetical protein